MSTFNTPQTKKLLRQAKAETLHSRKNFRANQINDEDDFWFGCLKRREISEEEYEAGVAKRDASLEALTPEWWLKDNGFTELTKGLWNDPAEGLTVTKKVAKLSLNGYEIRLYNDKEFDDAILRLKILKEAFHLASTMD